MSNATYTQGNLALTLPASAPKPAFTVIEGGRRREPVQAPRPVVVRTAPQRAGATVRIVACAALAIVMLGGLLTFAFARNQAVASAVAAISYEEVTVEAGDSLWSIAAAHPAQGLSTDELVQVLQERNGLERAGLTPGQVIAVPSQSRGMTPRRAPLFGVPSAPARGGHSDGPRGRR